MIKDDPVCKSCVNTSVCKGVCPPVAWIDGYVPRKEPLLRDLHPGPSLESKNYNEIIAELIRSRENPIEILQQIHDIRTRAISSMIVAGISRNDISTLLQMSHRQIIRILNKTK